MKYLCPHATASGQFLRCWRRGSGAKKRRARVRRTIETRLEERGVPVRELNLVEHRGELRRPLPLRCDLKESAFGVPGDSGGGVYRLTPEEATGREDL